jgi:hypothetical protein
MEEKIEMTEDIEYFLNKAKDAIVHALEVRDPLQCLSQIRQAEITIRSHVVYLQAKPENENKTNE